MTGFGVYRVVLGSARDFAEGVKCESSHILCDCLKMG
jgi:hypothetical protein